MRWISGASLQQGAVITPTDVERELVEVVEQLEAGTAVIVRLATELEQVTTSYELGCAQALLRSSEKSADRRKAQAMLVVEDLYRQRQLLEAKLRMARDMQHDLRAQLEAIRSVGASVRSSMWEGQGSGGSNSTR